MNDRTRRGIKIVVEHPPTHNLTYVCVCVRERENHEVAEVTASVTLAGQRQPP